MGGGRCGTRTHGLWFRRPTLYPPELIAHGHLIRYFLENIKGECVRVRRETKGRVLIKGGLLFHEEIRKYTESEKGKEGHRQKNFDLQIFLLLMSYIFDKSKKLICSILFRQRSSDGRATDL